LELLCVGRNTRKGTSECAEGYSGYSLERRVMFQLVIGYWLLVIGYWLLLKDKFPISNSQFPITNHTTITNDLIKLAGDLPEEVILQVVGDRSFEIRIDCTTAV